MVLYLGDTALDQQGAYLAGVMAHHGISYNYVDSGEAFSLELLSRNPRMVIVSDYPAGNFSDDQLDALIERIGKGMGFAMIGGWESFTGLNHEYTDTALAEVLPVAMQSGDDRVNCDQPCMIEKLCDHAIVEGLPFDERPPMICGYNRVKTKRDATTILAAQQFKVRHGSAGFAFEPAEHPDPMLVVGDYGKGRVAVFAGDVAPHWASGLVDWGDTRITAQAPNAETVEVGNFYTQLFANLIAWTARTSG